MHNFVVHSNKIACIKSGRLGTEQFYKQFYFEDPYAFEKWMRANINHPQHGLFVDIVSFNKFFRNKSYIERNNILNELYMYNKIGYGTKSDSILGKSFQNILLVLYGEVSIGYSDLDVTDQV